MTTELQSRIQQFQTEYLNTPAGQQHLATAEAETEDVKKIFEEIRAKYQAGQDITDDVLNRLLPHSDTSFHRENDYRVSTWPCISKDVRKWFEGAGWKKPQDWQPTARLLFEAVDGLIQGDLPAWQRFVESPYRHGFGTGFISPILFCLDQQYPVINSKVVKTYRYCTTQLGRRDDIDASLENYFMNASKVKTLQQQLAPLGITNLHEFDIFCHFMVSKRLGGGDLTQPTAVTTQSSPYVAWLFVANPKIFTWEQAFPDKGVDWTGSRGAYPQKLIREQMKPGDRVFGYVTGPHYAINCELRVADVPYQTDAGTWAVDLAPVRWLKTPISLATLKSHPVLSQLKFIQQTQLSVSGFTDEQLAALEQLIVKPDIQTTVSSVERLCQDLAEAQHDTTHPDRFEALLADVFTYLGFEAEHVGGAGNADVVVTAQLGVDTYRAIIDAKTHKQGATLSQVNYQSILDHKEENTADYALVVAGTFAGGKTVEHAIKANLGLLPTGTLLNILRQHEHFPFSLSELRPLFETRGLAAGLDTALTRVHMRHIDYLQVADSILQIMDQYQRQQDTFESISGQSIALLMAHRASVEATAIPTQDQVEVILALLSNKVLGILTPSPSGYVLTLPPAAARQRIAALAAALSTEE